MRISLWRAAGAVVLFASGAVSPAWASGGATPPPLQPGLCATVVPQNPATMTQDFASVTLKAQITSCSQLVQSNLVVDFASDSSGVDGYVFECDAPENPDNAPPQPLSYTLSPGASTGVTCHHNTFVSSSSGSAYTASGTGTATLFAGCA